MQPIHRMSDIEETPKQRSTEHHGVGQSGYTAGRRAGDPALEKDVEDRNAAYPKGAPEVPGELGEDDRFTGRGRAPWSER